ncbi:MAG: alpha/beta fold hydrolase [Flavobacteriaceae bacterium]
MEKKKKHHQGFAVPLWLRLIFKSMEFISPYLTMRLAAYIFSKPLKFKIPEKEQKALRHCSQGQENIPEIDRTIATYTWKSSGEKVLLAHGWSGRGTQMYRIAETLHEDGYHVVAYDAPAHGKSSGKQTNILQMIATIAHLDATYGFDYLIGHSFGGMAIYNYCKTPNRVKKIVTLGAADNMRTIFDNYILSVGLQQKTSDRMTSYFEKKYALKIDDYSPFVAVQKLQIPSLILHDEGDYDVRVDCADNIAKHHPNATLMKTKGLGHRKILRDEQVLQHIKSFIQKS